MTQTPDTEPAPDLGPALAALGAARRATVLCHVQPDADTVGSGLAMAIALHRRGVPVCVAFAAPAELPAALRDLPGVKYLVAADDVPQETDLLITVDCGSAGRVGALRDRFDGADTVLVLDHHRSNTRFGTVNIIDESADSTATLIARLLDAWGVEIDRDIAHCLFAGLVTDTGSFRWARPGSHLLAERLLATGIDGKGISRTLLDTHPFTWLPMLSRVLGSAQFAPRAAGGAGLVYAVIRRADQADVRTEEVESVIDIVRTTAEATVAATFKETRAGASDCWSVSLRSREPGAAGGPLIDVSEVAMRLGGGGHRFAAGYTATGPVDDVIAALVDTLG